MTTDERQTPITFEAEARRIKGKEVAVWTDGLAVSTDGLWAGVFSLVPGKRYRVTLDIAVLDEPAEAGATSEAGGAE